MRWAEIPDADKRALADVTTERQLTAYALRCSGLSWLSCAELMDISPRTVRAHYRRAEARYGALTAMRVTGRVHIRLKHPLPEGLEVRDVLPP